MVGYSFQDDYESDRMSRAIGNELHISPKHSIEICRALKGMEVDKAKTYLEDVIALQKAVPFRRHTGSVGHRKGKMGPGKYPQKAAKHILKVLMDAENNAEYGGLDVTNLFIRHIAAHRGRIIPGSISRARGRQTDFVTETVHVEVILEEKEE